MTTHHQVTASGWVYALPDFSDTSTPAYVFTSSSGTYPLCLLQGGNPEVADQLSLAAAKSQPIKILGSMLAFPYHPPAIAVADACLIPWGGGVLDLNKALDQNEQIRP